MNELHTIFIINLSCAKFVMNAPKLKFDHFYLKIIQRQQLL